MGLAFNLMVIGFQSRDAWSQDSASDSTSTKEAASGETEPSSNPLNLDLLLEDPVETHDGFGQVRDRLRRLAREGRTPEDFESAADELADDGVFTTAIELLWFAEQMVSDKAVAAGYGDRMRSWAQAAAAAESVSDEGGQLFKAGRKPEAIEAFLRAIDVNVYSERAHFRLADAWRRIYQDEYGQDPELPPLNIRVRVFRDAYEHYRLALAIDPLFYDAYYGLSELRGLLPDNPDFLLRTQALTQRALDFQGELLPVLKAIERGESDGSTYVQLGSAFETLGAFEYAAFAYQCAVLIDGADSEVAPILKKLRMEKLGTGNSDPAGS